MTIYQHMAEELLKIAEEKKEEASKGKRLGLVKTMKNVYVPSMAGTALGMGAGALTGVGLGIGSNYAYKAITGKNLPMNIVAPAAGAAGYLGNELLQRWVRPQMIKDEQRAAAGE